MTCIIYVHTNCLNGKKYVGWCATSLKIRWEEHCKSARGKSTCYFHNAIRKWGTSDEVWLHEIIETTITDTDAKQAEIRLIAELKTFAYDEGNLGYNETRGGDGILGFRHSIETRERLRLMNTGSNSPAFGKPGANAGRTFSAETREKMSKSRLGQKRNHEFCQKQSERQKKSVIQLTLNGDFVKEFSSLHDAQMFSGRKLTLVGKCCRGQCDHAYGFRWKYKVNS